MVIFIIQWLVGLKKIGQVKEIEVKQTPKIKQQAVNKEAREKWFYFLQGYQK